VRLIEIAKQLESTRAANSNAAKEIQKQREELEELTAAGVVLREERRRLLDLQTSSAAELKGLTKDSKELEAKHHETQSILTAEKARIESNRAALIELEAPIATAKSDVSHSKKRLSAAREELEKWKAESGASEEAVADTLRQTENLRHRAQVAEEEMAGRAQSLLLEQESLLKEIGRSQDELVSGRYLETIAEQNRLLRQMASRREALSEAGVQIGGGGLSVGLTDGQWRDAQEVFRMVDGEQAYVVPKANLIERSRIPVSEKVTLFESLESNEEGGVTFSMWMAFLKEMTGAKEAGNLAAFLESMVAPLK